MNLRKYFTSAWVGTREAAAFLSVSRSWLKALRLRGDGPDYFVQGRRIFYSIGGLESWAEARRRSSTCEGRAG
jgi:hypothetical protein